MNKSYICKCSDINSIQVKYELPVNTLPNNQAHVWIAGTSEWFPHIENFKSMLSKEELSKAGRFNLKKDHDLYVISHGLLRLILSVYITTTPKDLLFQSTEKGKPFLLTVGKKCFFNLSHAAEMVAIGINWIDEIGIDIEKIKTDFSWQEIAQDFYNAAELVTLKKADRGRAAKLFYTYWTRKESFLKAIGVGLIDDIKSLNVAAAINCFDLTGDESTRIGRRDWNIISFHISDAYLASVAFSPDVQQVNFYNGNQLLAKI